MLNTRNGRSRRSARHGVEEQNVEALAGVATSFKGVPPTTHLLVFIFILFSQEEEFIMSPHKRKSLLCVMRSGRSKYATEALLSFSSKVRRRATDIDHSTNYQQLMDDDDDSSPLRPAGNKFVRKKSNNFRWKTIVSCADTAAERLWCTIVVPMKNLATMITSIYLVVVKIGVKSWKHSHRVQRRINRTIVLQLRSCCCCQDWLISEDPLVKDH
eukprot:scaffold1251_cov106-Skeletonema_marinoi.AAC.6